MAFGLSGNYTNWCPDNKQHTIITLTKGGIWPGCRGGTGLSSRPSGLRGSGYGAIVTAVCTYTH